MSAQKETRSGFVGFFGTLPGIFTAVAGLITALVAAGLIGSEVSGPSTPLPATSEVPPAESARRFRFTVVIQTGPCRASVLMWCG